MSLCYAERQDLAKALRRHVYETSSRYDASKKMLLLGLIQKFGNWGLHHITDPTELELFHELLNDALE